MGKWVLLRSQTAIKSTQLRAILYQQQRSELSVAPVVPVGLMHPVVSSHCTAHRPFLPSPRRHMWRGNGGGGGGSSGFAESSSPSFLPAYFALAHEFGGALRRKKERTM